MDGVASAGSLRPFSKAGHRNEALSIEDGVFTHKNNGSLLPVTI